jgi:hypothetical protein
MVVGYAELVAQIQTKEIMMRVNTRVFSERMDMLDGIRVPNCPTQFRVIAENIMNLVSKLGFSIGNYNTMSELDRKIMLAYWREYDGLNESSLLNFDDWFIHKATSTELLRRSREFLASHNYILINSEVQERAILAGEKFRQSIKG